MSDRRDDSASEFVHLDVAEILVETAQAFLVRLESGEEVWLPMSLVEDAEIYSKGDVDAVMSVPEWFAVKEGLA